MTISQQNSQPLTIFVDQCRIGHETPLIYLSTGVVDSSASKPVQDTNYMVEKTYHRAPYLRAFGAYFMTE